MAKRFFDILASLFGLIILSPLLIIIALLIKIFDPGPILYRATRIGIGTKPFIMFKFRSMVVNADKIGGPWTPGDDLRLTPIGKVIRKYKLDELPELVNVVRGDMSLVGPRPEVPYYVDCMTPLEREIIFSVRPGITDWASVWNAHEEEVLRGSADPDATYRENIWPEKKRLQMKYAREHSMKTDILILFQTLKKIIP